MLLPCLNEAETLAACIDKAIGSLRQLGVDGEVLVADNGSSDGSREIARQAGARVVDAPVPGYGGALLAGIEAARGEHVVMADADDSYDLARLGPFIEQLRAGHDLVMGNRFRGGIAPGAMPFLHKYLGNPVLSWIGRALFGLPGVGDFHCGMRGMKRDRILALGLCMPGMEFASEMVVRSALAGYDIVEVPTRLAPDGRSRPPHLRTWRDGWRHLRFLLVLAPRRTLLWPGVVLAAAGLVLTTLLTIGPLTLGAVRFDVAALVYACLALLVGVQLILFAGCAKIYARAEGLVSEERWARWTSVMRLEVLAAAGLTLVLGGLGGTAAAVSTWGAHSFGDLQPEAIMRIVMPSATAIATGMVTLFSGLLASLLTLRGVPRRVECAPPPQVPAERAEVEAGTPV